MAKKRKNRIRRKNFLPTLIITVFLWSLLGILVYFVEPSTLGAIPGFFVLSFLALLFTLSTLFAHTRRGFIGALALTIFLVLRLLGVGNVINFLLLIGIAIVFEFYLSSQ